MLNLTIPLLHFYNFYTFIVKVERCRDSAESSSPGGFGKLTRKHYLLICCHANGALLEEHAVAKANT